MPELHFVTVFGTPTSNLRLKREDLTDPQKVQELKQTFVEHLKGCCARERYEARQQGLTLSHKIGDDYIPPEA